MKVGPAHRLLVWELLSSVSEAKAAAHLVTKAVGGRGAVREAIELILRTQEKWKPFVKFYSA